MNRMWRMAAQNRPFRRCLCNVNPVLPCTCTRQTQVTQVLMTGQYTGCGKKTKSSEEKIISEKWFQSQSESRLRKSGRKSKVGSRQQHTHRTTVQCLKNVLFSFFFSGRMIKWNSGLCCPVRLVDGRVGLDLRNRWQLAMPIIIRPYTAAVHCQGSSPCGCKWLAQNT